MVFATILLAIVFIFCILGIGYTKADDEAIRGIPSVLASTADRLDFVVSEVERIEVLLQNSVDAQNTLIININNDIASLDPTKTANVNDLTSDLQSSLNSINDEISSGTDSVKESLLDTAEDIRNMKDDADEGIDEVQSTRYVASYSNFDGPYPCLIIPMLNREKALA